MKRTRRGLLKSSLGAGVSALCLRWNQAAAQSAVPVVSAETHRLSLEVPAKFWKPGEYSGSHPRAGIVAGAGQGGRPRVVMTFTSVELTGSDIYKNVYGLHTDDLGKTWSQPLRQDALSLRTEKIDGQDRPVAASDLWPTWHAASRTLLVTGHSVAYTPDWRVVPDRPRATVYAGYDPQRGRWSDWRPLEVPPGTLLAHAGAGSTQRVDLPDGTILLPFYFKRKAISPRANNYGAAVMKCSYDGRTLRYLEHGDELTLDITRGFSEPSLARFEGAFFLTLRNDERGYVTRGRDGLRFEPPRPWTFDDGGELGSYNTQQHWVTHRDGLFLVYTRRGADNDHVFRHRAPLFMARVDTRRLTVIRKTEQILVPQRGARLGNFGVTDVTPDETWVTTAEWMQPRGVEKHGSDGSIYVARIHWNRPNT